jgi:GNAT superfamily N-acetyltransferase
LTDDRRLVPYRDLTPAQARALQAIYEEAFEADEKVPFEYMLPWADSHYPHYRTALEALFNGDDLIGFAMYNYLSNHNLGYLAYIAVRSDLRGRGHGDWLCRELFARLEQFAREACGQPPRFTFWEVRDPSDAENETERLRRQQRIDFYQRLGGQTLPMIDYICPPVGPDQPDVPYLLMVRTYPSGRELSDQDLVDVTMAGLVEMNDVSPQSEYVRRALRSLGLE